MKVVHMVIGGNDAISEGQQQQIHNFYMGLKGIAAASESITDRQFLPKHSNVLEDSPPALRYEKNSRKIKSVSSSQSSHHKFVAKPYSFAYSLHTFQRRS